MYCSNNPLQIKTIPTIIGMPILNGSIKWKCDYNLKKLKIHLDYQIQMNYEMVFQLCFGNSRLKRSIHLL
jgi:hypothetical protein